MPTTITDGFTRSNASTLGTTDTGETWAYAYPLGNPGSSFFGIVSNAAYVGQPTGGSSNQYQAYVDFTDSKQLVTFQADYGNHSTPHLADRGSPGIVACLDTSAQTGIEVRPTAILRMTGAGSGTIIYGGFGARLYDYSDIVAVTVRPGIVGGVTHTLVDLVVNGTTVTTGVDSGALLTGTNVGLMSEIAEDVSLGGGVRWYSFSYASPPSGGWSVGSIRMNV